MKDPKTRVFVILTSIFAIISLVLGGFLIAASHSSKQSSYDSMPSDAGSAAAKWLMSDFTSLNKSIPSNFFSTSSSDLTKLSNGDFSFIPESTRNHLDFTDDVSGSSRTITESVMKASSYSAIIMGAQTYATALKSNSSLTTNLNLISVDSSRGLVYIPLEAITGSPADILFIIQWDGSDWKYDGDALGYAMSAKIRVTASSSSSQESGSSK